MKILSAALATALLVFVAATAWMEVVQPRLDAVAKASALKGNEVKKPSKRRVTARQVVETDDEFDEETIEVVTRKPKKAPKPQRLDALAEATRTQLLNQFADVKRKEDRLLEREDSIRMICEDIRRQLVEIQDVRDQSAANIAFAERTIRESTKESTEPTRQARTPRVAPRTSANSRASAEARITGVVRDLANRGNYKDAAALLGGLKDRDVARILGSLTATSPDIALRLSNQVQANRLQATRPIDEAR